MTKFIVSWEVVESSDTEVVVIAKGETVKEAEDAKTIRAELTKLLTDNFGTMTGYTDRGFVINIRPCGDGNV